jgi:alkylhydroperoxidase/carboxymuconolactone decarboxylase family protein YurZ
MLKTFVFAIAITAVAAASVPAQARLASNGTSLNGITTGAPPKGALNNGVTVQEIKAALLHATAYCGIPA